MFVGKTGACPSEAPSGAPLKGRLLVSATNITHGRKGWPGTNAQE